MATKESHHDEFPPSKIPAAVECCMCGDHGLSQELFRCRICLSRFQHRYCSNLYPKTGTYKVCNWCISKQGDKLQRSQSSLSFTYRSNTSTEGEEEKEIKKKVKRNDSIHGSSKKEKRGGTSISQVHHAIKKQVHSDQSIGRKKMVYRGEKMLRRTKSEGIVNGGMIKQVFRGKVQRYKLLEEVSVR